MFVLRDTARFMIIWSSLSGSSAIILVSPEEPGPSKTLCLTRTELPNDSSSYLHRAPGCHLYTSDAADDSLRVAHGRRRIIKKN